MDPKGRMVRCGTLRRSNSADRARANSRRPSCTRRHKWHPHRRRIPDGWPLGARDSTQERVCITDRRPRPRLSRMIGRNQNHPMTVAPCVPKISLVKDHPIGSSRCMQSEHIGQHGEPREALMACHCGTDGSAQMEQERGPHIPTAVTKPADRCEDAKRRVQLGHRAWV